MHLRLSLIRKTLWTALFIGSFQISWSQPLTSQQIDSVVEKVRTALDVPGIAVGIVYQDSLVFAKGYGYQSLATLKPVDANTLFGIASNSKAFTCAALAMLVDEHKLSWDDKVNQYLPEFKMYDPYVTESFTIRDLLTHRSGLGLGAGDLMMFPDSNSFTRAEIIHNLRYLKPVSSFRTKFDYDNNLYIVAGEVIAKASGMSWEDFIEKRIMAPIGMRQSAASLHRLPNRNQLAVPHAPVNGKVQPIAIDWSETANAAGGLVSSINELSIWVKLQINKGKYGVNQKNSLFSTEQHAEMWTPQTVIPAFTAPPYNTHFSSYGLGWFLSDVKGYKQAMHTGGLAGMVTQVTILPELKLGIIVLTNQQSGAAFTAITNSIKDAYLDIKGIDRIKIAVDRTKREFAEAKKITDSIFKQINLQVKSKNKVDTAAYLGTYRDDWFGTVHVSAKNGKMWFSSEKSPKLSGELQFYKGNTFVAIWPDRSMDADAFVQFNLDTDGKGAEIKMNAISPMTDFSFDFQDLHFKRTN
jgi:CubicO group peptidase (beta-lactamase class C family)